MSVELVNPRSWIWLLLGLCVGVLIGLGIDNVRMKAVPVDSATFILGRVVNITIDESQQEELFAQLQKFAEKWQYAIRIAPVFEGSDTFHVGLWRTDMKAIGAYFSASGELQLAFTDTESTRPTPDQYFEEEIQDLKNPMDNRPSSTFTVWTPPAPPE